MRCQYCCWRYTHPGWMWDRWAFSLGPRGHVPPSFPQACLQGAECRGAPGQAGPHLCCPALWSARSPLPPSQVLSPSFVCKLIPWAPQWVLGWWVGRAPTLKWKTGFLTATRTLDIWLTWTPLLLHLGVGTWFPWAAPQFTWLWHGSSRFNSPSRAGTPYVAPVLFTNILILSFLTIFSILYFHCVKIFKHTGS